MKHFVLLACAILLSVCIFPSAGQAAILTDVLDASDDNDDVFDFSLSVDFTQVHEQARISRERNTISSTDKRMLTQREFEYNSIKSTIDVNMKFGIYKDLEFHINLPITIEDSNKGKQDAFWRNKYWAGDYVQNQLDYFERPSLLSDKVFGFAEWEAIHKGVGDMTLGFSYSPVNQERVKEYPTWVITLDIQVPTGPEQKPSLNPFDNADNRFKGVSDTVGVGKKLVALTFKTAISKRFGVVDPYFGMHYKLTIDTGGLIKDPRHEGNFLLGMEVVAHESKPDGANEPKWKVAFDFRMQATILGKGQDFSSITDPLAWRKDKVGSAYWPDDPRRLDQDNPNLFYYYPNGTAEYELPIEDRYTYIQGIVGLYAVLAHYITLKSEFGFGHRTEHFLSLPDQVDRDTLRPLDMDGYNTQINEVGARIKLTDSFVFSYTFSIGFNY